MMKSDIALEKEIGKFLFIAGFLWTCVVGTAPDMALHMIGIPICATGALIIVISSMMRREITAMGILPWCVILFIFYFGSRALLSPVKHLADMDLFLMGAFLSGFCAVWYSGRVRWLEPWIWIVAIIGGGVGIWQVTKDPTFNILQGFGMRRPLEDARASGFFYNQNPAGTFWAMVMLLSGASFFIRKKEYFNRILAAIAMVISAIGLTLTFCRAAFLGVGLGFGIMIVATMVAVASWHVSAVKKFIASLIVLLATSFAGYLGSKWLAVLAENRSKSGDIEQMISGIGGRLPYWRTGLSQFLDYPVTGAGSRTFSYMSLEYWDKSMNVIDIEPHYVHGEYVQILAEYGFLGFLIAVVLVIIAGIVIFRNVSVYSKQTDDRAGRAKLAWCVGTLGAGMAFLTDIVFSYSGHFAPMALLAGILLGGVAAIKGNEADTLKTLISKSRNNIGQLTMIVFLISANITLWYPGFAYGRSSVSYIFSTSEYMKGKKTVEEFHQDLRDQAMILPRYPAYYNVGQFSSSIAQTFASESEERKALNIEALSWLDKAVLHYPESIEARIERAIARQDLRMYQESDEDFKIAGKLGKNREFYFRSWMLWGEAKYKRAVTAWNAGDMEMAAHWMKKSRDDYLTSKKLGYIRKDNYRWTTGYERINGMVEFFKRTGIWSEKMEEIWKSDGGKDGKQG